MSMHQIWNIYSSRILSLSETFNVFYNHSRFNQYSVVNNIFNIKFISKRYFLMFEKACDVSEQYCTYTYICSSLLNMLDNSVVLIVSVYC